MSGQLVVFKKLQGEKGGQMFKKGWIGAEVAVGRESDEAFVGFDFVS